MPSEDAPPLPPTRQRLDAPEEHEVELVETPADLEELGAHVARCASVALDTEANSMFAYRERTCILQLTARGRSAIVDVLAVEDLGPLRRALDREDVEVVLHGGDYDITVLTRDHDFRFRRVFDTMIAATLLGDAQVGLAALVQDHFGVALDKRYQRADWGRRPLTPEQIDYLRRDTMYLPTLRAHYVRRLAEADITEEAHIEFARLATRQGSPARFDEEGWRRIKGARGLDARARAVLRRLYLWREDRARARDMPPFKVLAPAAMVALARQVRRPPRHPGELPGLTDRQRKRHGRDLVPVVAAGVEDAAAGRAPGRAARPRPTPQEVAQARTRRRREDRLRAWRRREAQRRGVPNAVVLPNPALQWLLDEMPARAEDLGVCPDIGPKRVERYGSDWITILDDLRA
jgi:ribonuclease D